MSYLQSLDQWTSPGFEDVFQLPVHFSRPSAVSTSRGQCRLSGGQFSALEFRFVVASCRSMATIEWLDSVFRRQRRPYLN